jgi:hypothetical protein
MNKTVILDPDKSKRKCKKHNLKVGQKQYYLTILETKLKKNGKSALKVICDCNNIFIIERGNFTSGNVKSCGCMRGKLISKHRTIHGDSKNCKQPSKYKRLYRIWHGMKDRVLTPRKEKDKKNYMNKGITICNEWRDSYVSFKDWALNNGYEDHLTIDRVNNNEGYYPENCRWATMKEQNTNRAPFELERDSKGRFCGKK